MYFHLFLSIFIDFHLFLCFYPFLFISMYFHLFLNISIYFHIFPSISIYFYLYLSISIYFQLYRTLKTNFYVYPSIFIYFYPFPARNSSSIRPQFDLDLGTRFFLDFRTRFDLILPQKSRKNQYRGKIEVDLFRCIQTLKLNFDTEQRVPSAGRYTRFDLDSTSIRS